MSNFKEGFERYREAINNDIKEIKMVISWLDQFRVNFEDAEISKVINFFNGYLSRLKLEKGKTTELSWYIDDEKVNEIEK